MAAPLASRVVVTVAELLLDRADDDHPGLRFEDATWSWRQVVAESAARASLIRSLLAEGAAGSPPDGPLHVGVLLGNVPEYVFWLGAAAMAGSVVVGINPTRRGAALAGDVVRTDCSLLVTDRHGAGLLDGLDDGIRPERNLQVDTAAYAELLAAHEGAEAAKIVDASHPVADDLYLLLFTSGTTGDPKAVRCTQGRLASIAIRSADAYGFGRDDVAYCAMPLFHGNALMVLWGPTLVVGGTVALAQRFSASGFGRDLRRYGTTTFTYVGKALAYVLATPAASDDAATTLRRGFGTEASVADKAAFEERFGCVLTEGYGSSEGGLAISWTADTPTGALGRANEDVAVVDPDTMAECPPARFDAAGGLLNGGDAIGEIVNRSGPGGFEGYYRDEEATSERIRNGWYWTGDLAYRDAAGYFYFAGRRGDWMRVDSENLTAGPIERVLGRYAPAAAVAVYAVPDPRSGDQVMAAVELLPEQRFDPASFSSFLAEQPDLGTKWAPAYVRVTRGLPQTASGKVRKEPLRSEGWWVSDETVYRRQSPGLEYTELENAGRAALRDEFRRHRREGLIGG